MSDILKAFDDAASHLRDLAVELNNPIPTVYLNYPSRKQMTHTLDRIMAACDPWERESIVQKEHVIEITARGIKIVMYYERGRP